MIIEQLVVSPFQANCYLIGCEETRAGAIVDPGDEAPRILRAVERLGLDIRHVLLTHAHIDHIGAAAEVARATGAPLALHRNDLPLLKAGGGGLLFGLPAPPYKEPDVWLEEGDEIEVGNYTLRVLFTPGHSPGHVTFYAPQAGALFDGDVLFAGSIGRTDLPGGSFETLMDSIAHKLMPLPDETVVYSGHGPATTIGRERVSNPFL
ncbi:MAG: MBL fold metallo-hydrolase [Caldilineae bacterium]|nr:MAG: MBL fold metallo-hydrolase [Caldilineae bacterium]